MILVFGGFRKTEVECGLMSDGQDLASAKARSEKTRLKYKQPARYDSENHQAKIVYFKLSFTSFHRHFPLHRAFLHPNTRKRREIRITFAQSGTSNWSNLCH